MRISDWSSDVCSSDLAFQQLSREHHHLGASRWPPTATLVATPYGTTARMLPALGAAINIGRTAYRVVSSPIVPASVAARRLHLPRLRDDRQRSEEHTSELQSLMRNSYAVFCLNK